LLERIKVSHEIRRRWRLRYIQLWTTKERRLLVKLIVGIIVEIIGLLLKLIRLKFILKRRRTRIVSLFDILLSMLFWWIRSLLLLLGSTLIIKRIIPVALLKVVIVVLGKVIIVL
jgi:hypothetical protein